MCKREDVFVVSKVWATYTSRCELGLEKSLEKLGLGWVDLFLVVCSSFSFSSFFLAGWLLLWGLGRGVGWLVAVAFVLWGRAWSGWELC